MRLRGSLWLAVGLAFMTVLPFPAAADILTQYEFAGQPGSEVSVPASFSASGLTAIDFTRGAGLTPSAGLNSINSSGWNTLADDFYRFGLNVLPGFTATVDELLISSRSAANGPGFINVFYSADGGPEQLITTLTMPSTQFVDADLTFAPLTVSSSLIITLMSVNSTAANGGMIGSAGTYRVGDYSPDGGAAFQPVTLEGTLTPNAVPEPSAFILLGTGLVMIFGRVAGPVVDRRRCGQRTRES